MSSDKLLTEEAITAPRLYSNPGPMCGAYDLRRKTGGFIFAAVGVVASVVLFAILTVLRRQLRIMKIMNTEDFE